jgi:hypothetical protein
MKKSRSVSKAIEPAGPSQAHTLSDDKEKRLAVESNLSPERIMDGASDTTILLNQIHAHREELHQLRDWGINE